ncbi:UNVERIFIED_CONTAM: hypothetical protein NCL1_03090 [Trichonephila clavipes]
MRRLFLSVEPDPRHGAATARGRCRAQYRPRRADPALAVPDACRAAAGGLSGLSGLRVGLRFQVPGIDAQQHPLAAGGARCIDLLRSDRRRPDRPYPLGQFRQGDDLHADGDFLRRCLGDLEIHLRLSWRRPDRDRHAQCDLGLAGWPAANLADAGAGQQLHADDCADLDSDRLCHGDPVRSIARHPRGNGGGRDPRRCLALADLRPHQGAADLGHHRRGLDHHHHYRAEGFRHRAGNDQWPVGDAGSCQPHVRLDVPRQ